MRTYERTPEELASAARKVELVLNIAGNGNEQINVLAIALSNAVVEQSLDMTSVINGLTTIYLDMDERFRSTEDDDDDY
jgi:hypothetical protein